MPSTRSSPLSIIFKQTVVSHFSHIQILSLCVTFWYFTLLHRSSHLHSWDVVSNDAWQHQLSYTATKPPLKATKLQFFISNTVWHYSSLLKHHREIQVPNISTIRWNNLCTVSFRSRIQLIFLIDYCLGKKTSSWEKWEEEW